MATSIANEYLEQLGACALSAAPSCSMRSWSGAQLTPSAKREMIVSAASIRRPSCLPLCVSWPGARAVLIGRVQDAASVPHKRQFWAYCGLALEMRDSGEYRVVDGQVERRKKPRRFAA